MPFVQIMTTVPDRKTALRIGEKLLEDKLCACFQIVGPINSLYRWKGKIEKDEEFLCLIKTREDLIEKIEESLRKMHPYEVPEFLVIPVVAGSADYISWLDSELLKK
ncbi:MAG: divalent-cation tolerance protein CutA [Candidatus Hydrothermota bacterium]|nr:MAG: divalent-cation tolerance protein CutA [Candidatus Hydrothermae bacterium]